MSVPHLAAGRALPTPASAPKRVERSRLPRAVEVVVGLAWLAFLVHALVPGDDAGAWFDDGVYYALLLAASLGCVARAVLVPHDRWPWAFFAVALSLWTIGDLYYLVRLQDLDVVPMPSPADAFYLAYFPFMYGGVVMLMRRRLVGATRVLWLDGITAALTVAALAAALLVGPIRSATDGTVSSIATNLAYPIGDVVLIALLTAVAAAQGFRLDRAALLLIAGLVAATAADGTYLVQVAEETYTEGGLVDAAWAASLLLIGAAAWRDRPRPPATPVWRPVAVLPLAFGTGATGLLVASYWLDLGGPGPLLASAAVLTVLVRLAVTLAENRRLLSVASDEAGTDALTGLANRRALVGDLDLLVPTASAERPLVVALFDLDGFKRYNDTYGHPAGDALLRRLGGRLRQLEQDGARVFRLGGDEFCLVAEASPAEAAGLIERAVAALSEESESFSITASFGSALLPAEAREVAEALRLADVRLYSRKAIRDGAFEMPHEELLRVLDARVPGADAVRAQAAALAQELAAAAGMTELEQQHVVHGTLLRDVGTLAVPDDLVAPARALNEDEERLLACHPTIGERIVSTVPALRPAGPIVRSSYERWDGSGFPDGRAGADIPLGARIVALAAAYAEALHASGGDLDAAIAAVARDTGSAYDPDLVVLLARCTLERATTTS